MGTFPVLVLGQPGGGLGLLLAKALLFRRSSRAADGRRLLGMGEARGEAELLQE